jgi:predicted glutamine amidotransferase
MCRFIGFLATHPTRLNCTLVDSPNSLMAQSSEDLRGFSHADGWGMAYYDEPGKPVVLRHPRAAHECEDYTLAARGLTTRCAIVHVRWATVGSVRLENTHPFHYGEWSFAHNGTLPYFRESVQERMFAEMTPHHRAAIKGTTDSESFFHFILSRMEMEPERPVMDTFYDALEEVIGWCHAAGPTPKIGVNVIMTDGKRLIGSRWLRTLFHADLTGVYDCEFCGVPHQEASPPGTYKANIIASEPTTMGPWTEIPDRSAFEVHENGRLEVRQLE